ncbi:MAG: heavy-metal-associated domain-containing protein [Phycisphaerales bacterium]
MIQIFELQGLHCGACVDRVSAALKQVPGVTAATVTLHPPRARIDSDTPVSIDALAAAVRSAGSYTISATPEPGAPPDAAAPDADNPPTSLYPLILIVAFIAGVTAMTTFVRATGGGWHGWMNDFMAGFFLVFSFFKFLDLRGFVSAYRRYDLLAAASPPWAWAYPFVELTLGVAYLLRWQPVATNIVTLVLMLIGAAGVLRALARRQRIRCACLGTALNLPMTTVTLIEDLAMAAMAAAGLAIAS